MDLTKSNSEKNFKVRLFNFWWMYFLFLFYPKAGFSASTAVSVSISSIGQKAVKKTEDTHFQLGMYNMKMGLYDHAIAEFQEVLKLNPAHGAAHCQMGAVYRLKNMLNESADAYQHALTVPITGNSYGVANLCLGMIYSSQGKFQVAEQYAEKAVELMPEVANSYCELGNVYTRRGKFDLAIAQYQKALQLDQDLAEAYHGLGYIRLKRKQAEKALEAYLEAVTREPYNQAFHYNLATVYRRLNRMKEARGQMRYFQETKAYQDTIQRQRKESQKDPKNVLLHAQLAETHLSVSNIDEAIEAYQTAITLQPSFVIGHSNLGTIYTQQGEFEKAIDAFQKVIQLDKSPAEPYLKLGWIYARQQKYDLAESYLLQASQRNPKLMLARQGLGEIYIQQGNLEGAIDSYVKLVEVHPTESHAWLRLGVLRISVNQPSKAIESFKKVIEIDSESADAYNNLAWLYADLQINLDQAVGLAKKAVELAPTSSNFDTLAYVYYQHKEYPQAEEAIKRAIKISPDNQKYNEMLEKIQSGQPKGINE